MGFSVRAATAEDAEGIARVHVSSWQAAYAGLVPQAQLDALSWEARLTRWSAQLDDAGDPGYRTLVALDGTGTVVAFATFGPARDADLGALGSYEVLAIYAVPDVWGRGVGRALLAAVEDALPPDVDVVLWVLSGNTRGRAFYERSGFVADGTVKVEDVGGAPLEEMRYRRSGPHARCADTSR
ncbi:MAG: GNAT family N-acetyltransferase [Actinomycetota bacterium]|nr:GNAT family N-acetyltransferase [Actinomycetota bacterium]